MKRRDELRSIYDILVATMNPKNENIPFRIMSQTKLRPGKSNSNQQGFREFVTRLETNHLIRIERNVRKSGSRNKFFIREDGEKFVFLYRKAVSLIGRLDDLPDIEPNSF